MTREAEALRAAQDAQDRLNSANETLRLAIAARDSAAVELVRAGFTLREAAALIGVSFQRVGQLMKADREAGWGALPDTYRVSASDRLREAREAFYLARTAQEQRAERVSLGYAEESRAFYGGADVAQSDDSEQRVRWAGFHVSKAELEAQAS